MTTKRFSSLFLSSRRQFRAFDLGWLKAFPMSVYRGFKNRRAMRQLLELDARSLRDIGLTPHDVRLARARFGGTGAINWLCILRVERRAASRAQSRDGQHGDGRKLSLVKSDKEIAVKRQSAERC